MNDTELLNAMINGKIRVYKQLGFDSWTVYDYNDDMVGVGETARLAIQNYIDNKGSLTNGNEQRRR